MMRLVKIMVAIFKKEFNVDGLNIGINVGRVAGAGLEEHCHIHIVPRWFGDKFYACPRRNQSDIRAPLYELRTT